MANNARQFERRAEMRRIIDAHKEKNPCVDCGESDPIVLEFDHVRGEKKFRIGAARRKCGSIGALLAEMAKCDMRCANCHRRKTMIERGLT